jgi:Tol biopolymer transport system component
VGRCSWSPDGRELIVTIVTPTEGDLNRQTWRVAADGSKTVELPIPSTETVWDWSPDGQWLATTVALRGPDGKAVAPPLEDIHVIRPDGTGDRLVYRLAGLPPDDPRSLRRVSPPRFSPDGRSLLWLEAEQANLSEYRVVVQRLDGGRPQQVTRGGDPRTNLASTCWSPDSRSLVLQFDQGSRRARDARFEVIDLAGHKIGSFSGAGLPDADRRIITYLIECQ